MVIVLPNTVNGLGQMIQKLDEINFNYHAMEDDGWYSKVHLHLPKFKIESTLSLVEPLTQVSTYSENLKNLATSRCERALVYILCV